MEKLDEVSTENKAFKEVSEDIINAISDLDYEDKEKNILCKDILFNIYKLLGSKEAYEQAISVLGQYSHTSLKNTIVEKNTFTEIATDIISPISKLDYEDKDKRILCADIMRNIYILLQSKESFYQDIAILNMHSTKGKKFLFRNVKKKEQ